MAANDLQHFRSLAVSTTAVAIKATPGNILGFSIINIHSAVIFVKFYNKAAAGVNAASDVPVFTVAIKANDSIFQAPIASLRRFSTAISVRVTTVAANADATAAGALPLMEVSYL